MSAIAPCISQTSCQLFDYLKLKMFTAKLYFALATLLVILVVRRIWSRTSALAPLPPGPKRWPLIGNMLDLPSKGQIECLHWIKHKNLYGPISSVGVLGQTIIVVHDREAASELLVKRAANYSDRPLSTFANEMRVVQRRPLPPGPNVAGVQS